METSNFLFSTLSLITLIIISSLTLLLSKKYKFPYTVLLVFVGILLFPISKIEFFSFLDDFTLNPDILFYVLLPILIFEAGYNIKIRELLKTRKIIFSLSVLWVLISVFFIWTALYYIFNLAWIHIPFLVTLLFWSIISDTDPIAVISTFKNVWAPERLTLIFEWESLFNDWTSVAIFSVIMLVILWWEKIWLISYIIGIKSFITMIFWWIIFWLISWVIFSKIISKINYNEETEITLALISAYVTFILTDLFSFYFVNIPVSAITATVFSSIVLWNYWKYKITPRSELFMNKFLWFFTYLSNSIIFIIMWIILFSVNINFIKMIPAMVITIIILMLARALSVYFSVKVINISKQEKIISDEWQKLLFWWWLKWVLVLIMVLMVPWVWDVWYDKLMAFQKVIWWSQEYNIKEFLLVLTIWIVFFTTFVNAPTIAYVMKKMWIDKLHNFEKVEYEEWKIIANLKIIKKINKLYKENTINKNEEEILIKKYKAELKNTSDLLKDKLEWNKEQIKLFLKRLILKYALSIEKNYLERFFYNKKLDEKHFKFILNEIEDKIEQIDMWLIWDSNINSIKKGRLWFENIPFIKEKYTNKDMYIISRTKYEIAKKVIKDLEKIPNEELWYNNNLIDNIIKLYEYSSDLFYEKRKELLKSDKEIKKLEEDILNKYFLRQEEKLLEDYYNKWIIPNQFYTKMAEEIDDQLYSNVNEDD